MVQTKDAAFDLLTILAKSAKIDIAGKTKPALQGGAKALGDNVKFGEKTTKDTVKPEEVSKNFADSA